jgi:glycosyltransferase involved in cell wall biosynthesis
VTQKLTIIFPCRDEELNVRELAAQDPAVQVVVNTHNFGHLRSPMHGFLQAKGDAVGVIASDLQDPPELFVPMVCEWEKDSPIVATVRNSSEEGGLRYRIRTGYYRLLARLTNVEVIDHYTGFRLCEWKVAEALRTGFRDPYPYFRGMIAELGLPHGRVFFNQAQRYVGSIHTMAQNRPLVTERERIDS